MLKFAVLIFLACVSLLPTGIPGQAQRHPALTPGGSTPVKKDGRPLLLQEQPLLLEDLLEQEKREQLKHQQSRVQQHPGGDDISLNEIDLDSLQSDVLGGWLGDALQWGDPPACCCWHLVVLVVPALVF